MLDYWNALAYTTKFSAIAFIVTLVLGFVSIGMLGSLLYYPVSIVFRSYPTLNDWRGDWVWPAVILVGMGWSFGFIIAGMAWHYLNGPISSVWLLRFIYGAVLWGWAAFLWFMVLRKQF